MKSFLASMILYSMGFLTALAQRSYPVPEYMGFSMAAQSGNNFVEEGKVWHMQHDDPIPNHVSYHFDYFIQGDKTETDEVFQEGRRWTIISKVFLYPTIGRDVYCISGYRFMGEKTDRRTPLQRVVLVFDV